MAKSKPIMCVDCGQLPAKQYCRCWECLAIWEKSIPKTSTSQPEMTDDDRYRLTETHRQKYEILLEAKKIAVEDLVEFTKTIKEDLGPKGLADIKDLIALSTPEGEAAVKAEMERKARCLRWMNVAIGTQGALFETDSRPITERAFGDGRRAGLAGEPHKNPHHHTNEAHNAYNEGFDHGQDTLATSGFKKIDDQNTREQTERPWRAVDDASPSDAWLKQTREQNERVDRAIKSDAIDSLTQN